MRMLVVPMLAVFFAHMGFAQVQPPVKDVIEYGLKGRVKSVMTYGVKVEQRNGQWVERSRSKDRFDLFDEYGNQVEWSFWVLDEGDPSTYTYVWVFDSSGRPEKVTEYSNAKMASITTFTYSEPGAINTSKSSDGEILSVTKYDSEGRKIEVEEPGEPGGKSVFAYNQSGQLESATYIFNNAKPNKITYKYDTGGFIEETSYFEGDQLLSQSRHQYEVDAQGNWIKVITKTENLDGRRVVSIRVGITVREITYY